MAIDIVDSFTTAFTLHLLVSTSHLLGQKLPTLAFLLLNRSNDISEVEARRKVIKEVNNKMGSEDVRLDIDEDRTVKLASGWIFHYDSKKYIETRQKRFMVCGNYPIFISKKTQKIYCLYPGVTLDSIEEKDKKVNVELKTQPDVLVSSAVSQNARVTEL
jgi:Immunity protein 35